MILYSLYIAEQQKRQLEWLAQGTGIKVAEHVRRAIDCYLCSGAICMPVVYSGFVGSA